MIEGPILKLLEVSRKLLEVSSFLYFESTILFNIGQEYYKIFY